mgnify:CR=1 FL=1
MGTRQLLTAIWPLLGVAVLSTAGLISQASLELVPASQMQGQWWRLISAHLGHTNSWHWLINMLGLALFGSVFWRDIGGLRLLGLVIALMLGISALLLLLVDYAYLGLSGVLYGLFVFGLLQSWRYNKWLNSAALLLLLGKVGLDSMAESNSALALSTEQLINAQIAHEAHLVGSMLAGGLFGLSWLWQALTLRKS